MLLRAFCFWCVMETTYKSEAADSTATEIRNLVRGKWTCKSCLAVLGLFGGLAAPVFGLMLTVVSWFSTRLWHGVSFRTVGTLLFVLSIPLLTLGAHYLDLLDKERHRLVQKPKQVVRVGSHHAKNWRRE